MSNKGNSKQYEGIKQKLLKLQALAERGYKERRMQLNKP